MSFKYWKGSYYCCTKRDLENFSKAINNADREANFTKIKYPHLLIKDYKCMNDYEKAQYHYYCARKGWKWRGDDNGKMSQYSFCSADRNDHFKLGQKYMQKYISWKKNLKNKRRKY